MRKQNQYLPSEVIRDFWGQKLGAARLSLAQFRATYKRFGPYHIPFARAFMGKSKSGMARPIDPDRQLKSYRTAAANRDRLAEAMYLQYCLIADSEGMAPPVESITDEP